VLERLGFSVTIRGDLIEAFLGRYDRKSCEERLDLLARLLASSRLLDMTMSDRDDIGRFTEAFFHGSYDFLPLKREDSPRGFSTHGGSWKRLEREGTVSCLQDGSQWGRGIASGIAGVVGKVVGGAYQEFLDTIEAYYYFPIAVLKNSELSEGRLEVRVKPVGGNIDRAGGIAFGIRGINDYFVLRSNALEGNIMLFEFVNGKRLQRMSVRRKIGTGTWHILGAEIKGSVVRGFYEGDVIMEYDAGKSLKGSVGLWTKADSVTEFDSFSIEDTRGKRMIGF
jgi:pyruvate,water dikinase